MNSTRVIKIGGSLLQRAGLLTDLERWQSTLTEPMINVWIIGGGATVDAIRDQDRIQCLSDSTAHWSSIKAMDANAAAFARRCPGWRLTDAPEKFFQTTREPLNLNNDLNFAVSQRGAQTNQSVAQNWVLQTHRWMKRADSQLEPHHLLPHSWGVTSDSIAAWVAIQIRASQVILLKSCQVPIATVPELARLGIVDSYLPALNLQQNHVHFTCEYLNCSGGSHP